MGGCDGNVRGGVCLGRMPQVESDRSQAVAVSVKMLNFAELSVLSGLVCSACDWSQMVHEFVSGHFLHPVAKICQESMCYCKHYH